MKIYREWITEDLLKVYDDLKYKEFVKKVVSHPTKTYSIFTLQEIQGVYHNVFLL